MPYSISSRNTTTGAGKQTRIRIIGTAIDGTTEFEVPDVPLIGSCALRMIGLDGTCQPDIGYTTGFSAMPERLKQADEAAATNEVFIGVMYTEPAVQSLFLKSGGTATNVVAELIVTNRMNIAAASSSTATAGSGTSTPHSDAFVTGEFTGPSGGEYTYTLAAATHGKGTSPFIQVQDSGGSVVYPDATVDGSGNITLTVSESPDGRFDGTLIVA